MPDRITLTAVLSACSRLELLSLGVQLHSWIMWSGLASDACIGCNLVDMYVKSVASGSLHDSRKVFDRMQDCKMMSWTSDFTFASLLSGVACISTIGKGEQINVRVVKSGLNSSQCIFNGLISMYSRCGNIEAAFRGFYETREKYYNLDFNDQWFCKT